MRFPVGFGVELSSSHAKATEQIHGAPHPRWLPFDDETRRIPLNLYAEMLRERGLTDMFDIVRTNQCGRQAALKWALFLGVADIGNQGPGTCEVITKEPKGVSAERFKDRFDKGQSVSSSLSASGSPFTELLSRRKDGSVITSAVRGDGTLDDVKPWRIGELARMQRSLEKAAIDFVKKGEKEPSDQYRAILQYHATDPYKGPRKAKGELSQRGVIVWYFLRTQGVSKKEAYKVAVTIDAPIQAVSVQPEPEQSPNARSIAWARMKALQAREAALAALRETKMLAILFGGAVVVTAAVTLTRK